MRARVWAGSMVGYRLVAGAGASLWVGLPSRPLGASRGGPWLAGRGGLWGCTASMGAPLCVGVPQRGLRWVAGVGLVSVSSVWLGAVRCVTSSAASHGGLLWWCVGVGLGLGGSWEGAGHAASGRLGGGGGACVWACVFALCSLRGFFICLSLAPLSLLVRFSLFFFGGGGCVWLVWGVFGAGRGCEGMPVPLLVWARVSWGMGLGWLLRSRFPVCVSALRHRAASGFRGAGPGGAGGGWLAAVVAWRLRGLSRLPGSAWLAWPDAGVRVGVFMAWDVWVVGSVIVAGLCAWWDGAGWVLGICAPKAWWVGLGHCGRCNGWWRCW